MIRQASRHLLRQPALRTQFQCSRRFVSTTPPAQRSRSWRNAAVRWGLAGGLVYYYNTSNIFADEPAYTVPPAPSPTEETPLPTLEEISQSRQKRSQSQSLYPPEETNFPEENESPSSNDLTSSPAPTTLAAPPSSLSTHEGEEEEAEDEHESQAGAGAFNEETGEINWDCPCLGGMAHGPCGEEFRTAFSCFVFSKEEPKGIECVPHFKGMQTCFQAHPEIYGAELEEEEAEARALAAEEDESAAAAAIAGAGGEGEHGGAATPTPALTLSSRESSDSHSSPSPPSSSKEEEEADEKLQRSIDAAVDAAIASTPPPPSPGPISRGSQLKDMKLSLLADRDDTDADKKT